MFYSIRVLLRTEVHVPGSWADLGPAIRDGSHRSFRLTKMARDELGFDMSN
jgi:hypothetical protein